MPVNEKPLEGGEDLLARRRELKERTQARYWGNDKESMARIRAMENAIADHISLRTQVEKVWRAECTNDELAYDNFPKQWAELRSEFPSCRNIEVSTMERDVRYALDHLTARGTEGIVKVSGRRLHESGEDTVSKLRHVTDNFNARFRAIRTWIDFSLRRRELIEHVCVTGVGYFHHGVRHDSRFGRLVYFGEVPEWRNVYTDALNKEMDKASFFFIIKHTSLQSLLKMFRGKTDEIRRFVQDFSECAENDVSTPDIQVPYGSGYIYDFFNWKGKYYEICMFVRFIAYEDFSRVRLLKKPTHMYGHNEIPVCQVKFDEEPDTGYPFSPLVRQRRGLEQKMLDTMRQAMQLKGTKSTIFGGPGATKRPNIPPHKMEAYVQKKIAQNPGSLLELGAPGATRTVDHTEEVQQLLAHLSQLNELAQPILGLHSNMSRHEQQEAMWQLSGPRMSLDYDLVKRAAGQILSNIEQFGSAFDYHFMMEREDLAAYGFDADQSLSGYRAWLQLAQPQGDRAPRR